MTTRKTKAELEIENTQLRAEADLLRKVIAQLLMPPNPGVFQIPPQQPYPPIYPMPAPNPVWPPQVVPDWWVFPQTICKTQS